MNAIQSGLATSPLSLPVLQMKSLVVALPVIAGLSLIPASATALSVTCHAEYGLTTEQLPIPATGDVFSFQSVNLGDRFVFKAQFLQERAKLKTYVYELRSQVPTLIHASEHFLTAQRCTNPVDSLGLNKVYSSDLEREMFFQCFVGCE